MLFWLAASKSSGGGVADMSQILDRLMNDEGGQIVASVLFGFALAFLFHRVCKTRNCLVFTAPPLADLDTHIYKFQHHCFKYEPYAVACASETK